MAEGPAAEAAAHHPPTGLGHQLQEAIALAARARHHHLGAGIGPGWLGHQQGFRRVLHDAEPIDRAQVGRADPQGIAVAIDEAVADAGEVEAGQQGIHHRRPAAGHRVAGALGTALLIDVELGAAAIANRRRHDDELARVHLLGAEHRGLGTGLGRQGPTGRRQANQRKQNSQGTDQARHGQGSG